jgi:hypothetical protein
MKKKPRLGCFVVKWLYIKDKPERNVRLLKWDGSSAYGFSVEAREQISSKTEGKELFSSLHTQQHDDLRMKVKWAHFK